MPMCHWHFYIYGLSVCCVLKKKGNIIEYIIFG